MSNKTKSAIRESIKQTRSKLSEVFQAKASQQICLRISNLEEYRNAKNIALYQAANGEVDLSILWHKAQGQGKICFFPVIHHDNSLQFLPATTETHFKKNKYGISEPDVDPKLALDSNKLDLIVLPLVAFDALCNRIGMGAGYYDRTLKNNTHCKLFGVAYQFQRVDFIEPQAWDVPVDGVITQRAIYWRSGIW